MPTENSQNPIDTLKDAEDQLEQSRARYRVLFEMESDAIVLIENATGRILEANPAAARMYGFPVEVLTTMRNSDLSAEPEETKRVTKSNPPDPGTVVTIPLRWHKKADGTVFPVEITGRFFLLGEKPVHIATMRDITERRKAEEEKLALERRLLQTQKLDAISYLAGGIAHDFNNLLAGIYGNIQVAQGRLTGNEDPGIARALEACMTSFARARSLTQQLLTFSRGEAPVRKRGSLESLLRDSVRFAMSGSNIAAELDIEANLSECEFDEGQIGQVMDNLLINARQAMPEGGRLRIQARSVEIGPPGKGSAAQGRAVEVSVSDSGPGMGEETKKHLFEPFFTTKAAGSGLGLATSRSIILKHGGDIEVDSAPGEGTVVRFFLPALEKAEAPCSATPPGLEPGGKTQAESASILVMDDEATIRDILTEMLTDLGYSVSAFPDGATAVAAFSAARAAGTPFAAAILDLTIPSGLGGREVIAEIRAVDPDLPVIASSGFSADPIMADPASWGFSATLPKPYLRQTLADLIASLIL